MPARAPEVAGEGRGECRRTREKEKSMSEVSILDITTEHVGPVYIVKATAARAATTQVAIEAVDLANLKGEALATAIREASEKAKARAIRALREETGRPREGNPGESLPECRR
jgi:mRNA-degrading endonuclease toxin of MazEF toxin-antitoxin module